MRVSVAALLGRRRAVPAYHVRILGAERNDDGSERWAVTFEELPGCIAQGASLSEAEGVLWRIAPAYLAHLDARAQSVPPPHEAGAVTFVGASIAMLPMGASSGPIDPGVTAPHTINDQDLRTVSQRLDATLRGS